MKKKLFLGLSMAFMVFVLAGCISIPIGDSVLEITTDGVEFVTSDDAGNGDDNNVSMDENNNDDFDMTNDNGENANGNENSDGSGQSDSSNDGSMSASSSGFCTSTEDHSFFTKHVNGEFYIPECAVLTDVKNNDHESDGYFEVPGATWDQVHDAYIEAHGDQFTKEDVNISGSSAYLQIDFGNETGLRVDINQGEEQVNLFLRYYK